MTIPRLFIFLIILLFLFILPSSAFEDNMQDHPNDHYAQGGPDMEWSYFNTHHGGLTLTFIPYAQTYNKVFKYYIYKNPGPTGYCEIYNSYGDGSDYWAFNLRYYDDYKHYESMLDVELRLYDKDGILIHSSDLLNYFNSNQDSDLYEFQRSSNNIYLYINGISQGSLGGCSDTPYYMGLWLDLEGLGMSAMYYICLDSVTNDGYVVGIGTEESPETWINTASDNEIAVEYSIKTIDPYADWDTYTYQMRVTWLDAGTIVNTTTLSTSKPTGFVVYNRSTLMPVPNYGVYKFDLLKNSVVMQSDYLTFVQIGASGTLSWDKVDYVPYQNASITYAVTPFTPADYNYYIRTYEINTGLVDTNSITANSGTTTESLDAWEPGSYYSLLVVVDKDDGTEYTVAFDVFDINNEVRFEGYTYDAENGTILNETNVNFIQSSSWYNDTSNATGYYELDGLSDSIEININASKTNFSHEVFTFTPLTSKLYTTNLYLFPTRSLNGTSIVEGMTVDYPLHQAVGNATVNLYNATWSNTTTSNAFGYYQFNLSLVNGTYTVNATLSGYDNSTQYSITVIKNESTVQNIVLNQKKLLTVTAIDSETNNPILNFTASVDGMTTTVGDGDAEFYLDWGLYTVTVTSSGYYSNSENVLMDRNRSVEISLIKTDSDYYVPHYVKFTVQNIWGTKHNGMDVSVYEGTDTTNTYNGTTGSDGSVTFKLSETTQYRITFINSTAGISETRTLYPVDDHYYIIVSSLLNNWDTYDVPIYDAIDFTISKTTINNTHVYINVSFNDSLAETTDLKVYLNQTNESDYFNQSNLDTWNAGAVSSGLHSFIVEDYAGQSYITRLVVEHTTYGTIDSTYSVSFTDDIAGKFPGIPPSVWLYSSIFILLFTGGIFVQTNVEKGMLVVCIMFFIFFGLGTFNTLPLNVQQSMLAGGILAFILSIIANLNKSNRDEGFS